MSADRSRSARVLIHVQHLLGIGHLRRAAALARALADSGTGTTLVSGGLPVRDLQTGGAQVVQLPPVRASDATFSSLVDTAGAPVQSEMLEARQARLLEVDAAEAPDVIVTETFPFGRRQIRHELRALLDQAARRRPRPLVVSSIRDILQSNRKPERIAETLDILNRHYDAVLVHGDPAFADLSLSFPRAAEIRPAIHYTGFICEEERQPPRRTPGADAEIVVSAGGGAVGEHLLRTAIEARALSRAANAPWRLLAGQNMAEARFIALRETAGTGIIVERARPDFRALLSGARLSISQAGYNTAVDLMWSGCPAVLVPFAAEGETEQSMRAEHMASQGLAVVAAEAGLSPETLANAVDKALALEPQSATFDLDGARHSAALIGRWLDARDERREATQ